MATSNVFATLIEHCPNWGYLLMLITAFLVALVVAGVGMRMFVALLGRVRRQAGF